MKDQEITKLIKKEEQRQRDFIRLIASENYASRDVRDLCGSVLMNKYSEGNPGARYYPGNEYVDEIELLAEARAKELFGLNEDWEVNVTPYSGTPANVEIYWAVVGKDAKILAMRLDHGGHLSHGHPISGTSGIFSFRHYGVTPEGYIDYEEVERIAKEFKPKLIVSGTSAYPRLIDYKRFQTIADSVGALHMTDMAHIGGLIAGGAIPSPFRWCDIVMTTTHKTLRGPRGAMIFMRKEHAKAIDKAVFPGFQGGPHNNTTAAIAVALKEATSAGFQKYAHQTIVNAKALAGELKKYGFTLFSGGTENHLMLVDLRPQSISGIEAEVLLYEAGIAANRNAIPNDPAPPYKPSGIRLGTPAVTTRGMKEKDMRIIAQWIKEILLDKKDSKQIKKEALKLTKSYPVP